MNKVVFTVLFWHYIPEPWTLSSESSVPSSFPYSKVLLIPSSVALSDFWTPSAHMCSAPGSLSPFITSQQIHLLYMCVCDVSHPCAGAWGAPGRPSWRQWQGPEHRSVSSAVPVDVSLSVRAHGTHWDEELDTTEPTHCVRTQAPDTCMCYQPDNSDTPPPTTTTTTTCHQNKLRIKCHIQCYY